MFGKALLVLALAVAIACPVQASSLTRPQIVQALEGIEVCMRTMCLPSGDPSMSLGAARDLLTKLNQAPNATDQWVIGRLNPVVALLTQKNIAAALAQTQAAVAAFVRPDFLTALSGAESCLRTMCIPSGNAAMSIAALEQIVKDAAKFGGSFSQWVTQRVNAILLLLQQKKLKEGLVLLQTSIKELPAQ